MKRHRLVSAVIAALFATALLVPASPASAKDTVHRCTNWSWTGPSNWSAACGTYGITISSPDGRRAIDWGFSSTYCIAAKTYRQSAARFMSSQRQTLAGNGVRFISVGPIRQVGRNYFRQTNVIEAGKGRKSGKGQAIFDYAASDNTGTYCYQSSKAMMVPKSDFRRGIRQLQRIYHSTAYFGPGLPKGPNGEPA